MNRASRLFVALCLTAGCASVYAEDAQVNIAYPRMWPGNFSNSTGLVSPFEDAKMSTTRFEQGWTLFRGKSTSMVPFVSGQHQMDDRGYDWNNKYMVSGGIKLNKNFNNGIIQVGGAYIFEHRFKSGRQDHDWALFANYWFGWQMPTVGARSMNLFSSFPGSSWGSVGNISPVERRNVIATAYAQQGVVLTRLNRVNIVPFVDGLIKRDTDKFDWNNGEIAGIGGKLTLPLPSGILEAGVAYKKEWRRLSHTTAEGWVWLVNFWYGWSPAKHGKER